MEEIIMTLTVTEKEHWKTRIEAKIDRRIQSLIAATNPSYLAEMKAKARSEAIKQLGIEGLVERKEQLKTAEAKLRDECEEVEVRIAAIVTGQKESEVRARSSYRLEQLATDGIEQSAALLEQKLMETDELGRQVLSLRNEREELLDTVWLATSPRQIRDLWNSVAELLAESPTTLQQAALNTEPVESSNR